MFVRTACHSPKVSEEFTEGITTLLGVGERIYMGREDGVLECLSKSIQYTHPIFTSEFDVLENTMVKEKIVALERTTDGGLNEIFFVANEKTMKVIKLRIDAPTLDICHSNVKNPTVRATGESRCSAIHSYIINSLSLNLGGDTLISADYLRVNIWSPIRMEHGYNLVDLKPQVLGEGLSFVINTAKFSPQHESIFAYSASNGEVALYDIDTSLENKPVLILSNKNTSGIKSISDFAFVDSNLITTRSLNTVSLFDTRNPVSPVLSVDLLTNPADQSLLNSSGAVYQTFKIATDGMHAYTGSCFNSVYCVNLLSGQIEEVLVGDKREYDVSNRVRCIIQDGAGFACCFNRQLHRYSQV
ncbi:serine/threonine-protein phosphatase 2A regulatory subunit B [Pancytospora epiphaga]|nr:serine/threonine-protein phosphatase 2A regulatory subunit B [Pancytospora epiphaga]